MAMVRYDPWRALNDIQSELGRLFGRSDLVGPDDQSDVVTSQWMPAVDIREEPARFVISADIPGVDPKEIEVTMENGLLTIRGERMSETRSEDEQMRRIERRHGVFYRRFALPESADPDGIEAKGRNGVLEIVVPKREKSQPRRISVAA